MAGGIRQSAEPGSGHAAGQLITSETAIVQDKNSQLLFLANMFNPETATGVYQDALAKIYFLTRQPARSTVVPCVCTGLPGTVIPGIGATPRRSRKMRTGMF